MSRTLSRRSALRLGGAAALVLPAWARAAKAEGPRLVTVSGAITEMVFALGAESMLVGSDTTSVWPEAALKTPKVGYMRQLSSEGLLSLRPSTVIATHEAGPPLVFDQLRAVGVRVDLVQADHSFDEVLRKLRAVADATGRHEARGRVEARLLAEWQATQQRVAAAAAQKKPRVLFVLAPSAGGTASVSGLNTAANAMVGFAGATNCLTSFDGYRPMTAEAVIAAAPDVVVATRQGIDGGGGEARFWERPGLLLTPAGKKRALVTLETLYLLGFGPRLPQAVLELHERVAAAAA
ncbi:MAG: ABC transporter substrate-binding protein [Pseudomonadota bacterium]